LFSDTVGFIRQLPKGLMAAFRATLEEVQQAALILHVTDISNPRHAELDAEVDNVLAQLGMSDGPRLHVFNKIDRLDPEARQKLSTGNGAVFVSAVNREGLDFLLERIDQMMPVDPLKRLRFSLPVSEGRKLALVHGLGRVLHSELQDSHMLIEAEVPESLIRRLEIGASSEG
jgi:GTP-binding protein HflX